MESNELEELRLKKLDLLEQLMIVDQKMRQIVGRETQTMFRCSCNLEFKTYFSRQWHIDKMNHNDHRPLGEQVHHYQCLNCKAKYINEEHLQSHNCKPVKPTVISAFGRTAIDLNIIE